MVNEDHPSLESMKAITQRNLHEAVEQFLRVNYGSSILTDWAVIAETVEPNLDNETDDHMLWLGTSAGLSSWRLAGLSVAMSRLAYASVIS